MYKHWNIYLSGAYSCYPEKAPEIFERHASYLSVIFGPDVHIWVPTRQIPKEYSWQEAMDLCEKTLKKESFDIMVVIDNEESKTSKGVIAEKEICKKEKIPVFKFYIEE